VTAIVDQPPPRVTDRRPSWDIVMSYVDQLRCDNVHLTLGIGDNVIPLVLVDMCDRDVVGRQRYGTPLTELDEHGVGLTMHLTEEAFPDKALRWYLHDVQQLCTAQIRASIKLRAMMEERNRRAASSTEEQTS